MLEGMENNYVFDACMALADRQKTGGIEDEVHITFTKEKGTDECHRGISASSTFAAINALGILTVDVAKLLGVPVIHVISVLTIMLTDTGEKQA